MRKIITYSLLIAAASQGNVFADLKNSSQEEEKAHLKPYPATLSMSYIDGRGIGYTQGYTSLKGLFFSSCCQKTVFPFIDIRGHVFNNGEWAANGGLGVRIAPSCTDLIVGFNAYYDYRSVHDHAHFNQIGIGGELLGKYLDFRINGYLPINSHKRTHSHLYDDYIGGYYIQHNQYSVSMRGVNAEFGGNVIKSKVVDVYSAIGPYYFVDHYLRTRHAIGGQFRLALNFAKYFSLEGFLTSDTLFKTRAQGQITLSFPLGSSKNRTKKDQRLSQPVKRYEIIVLDKMNRWNWNY